MESQKIVPSHFPKLLVINSTPSSHIPVSSQFLRFDDEEVNYLPYSNLNLHKNMKCQYFNCARLYYPYLDPSNKIKHDYYLYLHACVHCDPRCKLSFSCLQCSLSFICKQNWSFGARFYSRSQESSLDVSELQELCS